MKVLVMAVSLIFLSSCGTGGPPFDHSQFDHIQRHNEQVVIPKIQALQALQ